VCKVSQRVRKEGWPAGKMLGSVRLNFRAGLEGVVLLEGVPSSKPSLRLSSPVWGGKYLGFVSRVII
jgi:hypothetical protein